MTGQPTGFLEPDVVAAEKQKAKLLITLGGFFTALFLFAIIDGNVEKSLGTYSVFSDLLEAYYVLIIPAAAVLVFGILAALRVKTVKRYGAIFSADRDGVVTAEELARQTGKTEEKIAGQLGGLFERGFFVNCAFEPSPSPRVVLGTAPLLQEGIGLTPVTCPWCGTVNHVLAGAHAKCSSCGGSLNEV
ncbi:MAG: hypothetical protein IKQ92_14040 [Clostridia bacterium]|nr:hypothetical protein [Clostridia bacterium]